MRADSAISGFAKVAVHAEHLKPVRVAILLQPLVNLATIHRFTMLCAVVIYVVKRKERFGSLVATRAHVTAVCGICRILQFSVAVALSLSCSFEVVRSPFRSTLRGQPWILSLPPLLGGFQLFRIFLLPFAISGLNPFLVCLFPLFPKNGAASITRLRIPASLFAKPERGFRLFLIALRAFHKSPAWLLIV